MVQVQVQHWNSSHAKDARVGADMSYSYLIDQSFSFAVHVQQLTSQIRSRIEYLIQNYKHYSA